MKAQIRYFTFYGTDFRLAFWGFSQKRIKEVGRFFPRRKNFSRVEANINFYDLAHYPSLSKKIESHGRGSDKEVLRLPDSTTLIFDIKRRRFHHFSKTTGSLRDLSLLYAEGMMSWAGPKIGTLIMHAAGVLDDNHGYLFLAPSGGGKTTISALARKYGLKVISDESLLIKKKGSAYYFFGYPSVTNQQRIEKLNIVDLPAIDSIYFLKKDNTYKISGISFIRSLAMGVPKGLLYTIPHTDSDAKFKRGYVLSYLESMFKSIRPKELSFHKSHDVFGLLSGSNINNV